ncbi:fructan beta-fructosidase [Tenacibaculum sp. MAR_2009_124]|uniref:glycoside hydrolase family 32 protein n=1 Tax=Tenacibaculum sp. MAR_2009_124 TaxID=1250059 RepID=UPI00089A50C5|nr:glycoside hydrolase family 32 protein [Tenacibaculum sp. MAR_2009_124]SEC19240.1 fructan beta-fructosidase [Tenacibaculum sp. MAR_2009_124]
MLKSSKSLYNNISEENRLYRPQIHFTPKAKWMNDPNGMFFLNGTYHLFYQYYPEGNVWGPMHWGHATSKDFINWTEHGIALYPDELGYIFSGSAVVDYNNTSGLGDGDSVPIIAIFTYHDPEKEKRGEEGYQTQGIAYSLDEGFTWEKYQGNPVLSNPGLKDFRDPKVIWDEERNRWLMVLSTYAETLFYRSENLINWKYVSSFGKDIGAHEGVWECPDLFQLEVNETGEKKWVLLQSINPGGPNGGSGTQYFIGGFDGEKFTVDRSFKKQLDENGAVWLDYGRDNYAGVTWSNVPKEDGRRLFIGWMSNWNYADKVPTYEWRGTMTIPRELKLRLKEDGSYIIKSLPVKELFNNSDLMYTLKKPLKTTICDVSKGSFESSIVFKISLDDLSSQVYTFSWSNNKGDSLEFGLDNVSETFFIDRSKVGAPKFSDQFLTEKLIYELKKQYKKLALEVVIDKTSIEIFLNEGEHVFTEIFFPKYKMTQMSLFSDKEFTIKNLKTYKIKSYV